MPNTDRDNRLANKPTQKSPCWTQLAIDYTTQYPLDKAAEASWPSVSEANALSTSAAPAFDADEDRRARVHAWVKEGNKGRSSRRHTKRARKSRSKSTETQVLLPNLPSRPDLVKLAPLQHWVGGADKQPPFVGWFQCKNGTKKSAVLEFSAEEFQQMDHQFAAHIRDRFQYVATQKSLKEVTSSDLTEGHWMSEWWYQLHYDLPVSCSVLMECLDSCNPQRVRRAH